jgi:aryl-alcohol dehydrogenase-like predicted oxidoreductase
VDEVAKAHQATPSQIALAWLIQQPAVSSIILGVRTLAQLEDNLETNQVSLTMEELCRLDQVSKLEERYPYRFIEQYGSRNLNSEG